MTGLGPYATGGPLVIVLLLSSVSKVSSILQEVSMMVSDLGMLYCAHCQVLLLHLD